MLERTPSGKLAKFHFYKEPLVWVEGTTDISFYQKPLKGIPCRLEVAGGVDQCKILAAGVQEKNYPYIVVFDGHYDILMRSKKSHQRIIVLLRHSCENYLFEREIVQQTCSSYPGVGNCGKVLNKDFARVCKEIESLLLELTVIDVAHCQTGSPGSVMPNVIEPLLNSPQSLAFSTSKIKRYCAPLKKGIDKQHVKEARRLVLQFVKAKRLANLLPGHLVLSIIRHLILNIVRRRIGRNCHIDNGWMMSILTLTAWEIQPAADHRRLKRCLRRAVREAVCLRSNGPL